MNSDSILQNTLSDECLNRSSLCTLVFHGTDSKDPDIHVLDGGMAATKTHPHPPLKTECDYLYVWIKKRSHT